jgi:hypothetical protein
VRVAVRLGVLVGVGVPVGVPVRVAVRLGVLEGVRVFVGVEVKVICKNRACPKSRGMGEDVGSIAVEKVVSPVLIVEVSSNAGDVPVTKVSSPMSVARSHGGRLRNIVVLRYLYIFSLSMVTKNITVCQRRIVIVFVVDSIFEGSIRVFENIFGTFNF